MGINTAQPKCLRTFISSKQCDPNSNRIAGIFFLFLPKINISERIYSEYAQQTKWPNNMEVINKPVTSFFLRKHRMTEDSTYFQPICIHYTKMTRWISELKKILKECTSTKLILKVKTNNSFQMKEYWKHEINILEIFTIILKQWAYENPVFSMA